MRLLKPFSIIVVLILVYASCKKDADTFDTTPIFYFINGGTSGFDDNLILFPSADTVTFNMVISSTFLPSKDVTITISVEDSARQSYNTANSTNYQLMPASAYSFATTLIASSDGGSIYNTIPVRLNKQLLADADYMLPVVITSISDYKLDTSRRVIYLHTSGNKLAGIYASYIFKTQYTGIADSNHINDTASYNIAKSLIPTSATESQIDYAEQGSNGWKYLLNYESGVFAVSPNDIILSSVQSGSFKIIKSAYNPLTKEMYIKSSYKNLSGDERIVEESLTLQ